jgi:hypothetical protein
MCPACYVVARREDPDIRARLQADDRRYHAEARKDPAVRLARNDLDRARRQDPIVVERRRKLNAEWYQVNKTHVKELKAEWYQANKTHILEQKAAEYQANRDRINAWKRELRLLKKATTT